MVKVYNIRWHSHLAAASTPNIKAYDIAYSYEIAVIVHWGMKEMVEENKDVIYYLTLENENYTHPQFQRSRTRYNKGLYKVHGTEKPTVEF